ncbi:DUF1707 domain-containing protein [Rhodococcus sp. HM1]|uniref:DUF1707 SHOCT-like domain-containing protein n=1 Tax=unclassified Rhodococcus (in: high G+C Gram-positive bacteria) TaxID=192944 RepID=UPI0018CD9B45|nr:MULTISPECIES: DUF1707 domain-containing protein [unclassified Rhodococcus (in: high G+C Gram-positive bacteria)]MBH0121624.1 DUF1707 domain-containing protein [Rhodococcus sp. CX]MCK8670031.1 DUF1707 domain-containing protein [Rhodococcus sp. HM1]
MSDTPEVRIGTAERERALQLLGEHFAAGRLTLAEFEERSGKASAATTRSDLDGLFTDLPTETANVPAPAAVTAPAKRGLPDRWRDVVAGVTPAVALVLFFLTHSWLWFLLIPVVSVVLYAGLDQNDRSRDRKRDRKNRRDRGDA